MPKYGQTLSWHIIRYMNEKVVALEKPIERTMENANEVVETLLLLDGDCHLITSYMDPGKLNRAVQRKYYTLELWLWSYFCQ